MLAEDAGGALVIVVVCQFYSLFNAVQAIIIFPPHSSRPSYLCGLVPNFATSMSVGGGGVLVDWFADGGLVC